MKKRTRAFCRLDLAKKADSRKIGRGVQAGGEEGPRVFLNPRFSKCPGGEANGGSRPVAGASPAKDRPRARLSRSVFVSRAGMTLIEVLMATVILGLTLTGLMQGMSQCFTAFSVARRVEDMQSVLSLGEIQHPFKVYDDPVGDLEVRPDGSLRDGYTFERVCEEDDDEDCLFLVTTTVRYGDGSNGNEMKVQRYVYYKE